MWGLFTFNLQSGFSFQLGCFWAALEMPTNLNNNFRVALWTGSHLQITLMCIPAGESIGLEIHPDADQFIRVEQGRALVQMGSNQNSLNFQREIDENIVFIQCYNRVFFLNVAISLCYIKYMEILHIP